MNSRRSFIKNIGAVGLCACTIGIASSLTGCSSAAQVQGKTVKNKVIVTKESVGESKGVVVSTDLVAQPLYLYIKSQEEITCVLMLCTHNDCQLNSAGPILECPCHGSEFNLKGTRLSGPADRNLKEFKVVATATQYEIHIA